MSHCCRFFCNPVAVAHRFRRVISQALPESHHHDELVAEAVLSDDNLGAFKGLLQRSVDLPTTGTTPGADGADGEADKRVLGGRRSRELRVEFTSISKLKPILAVDVNRRKPTVA